MELYIHYLANYLRCNVADIHLYWKGRVALYAALKSAGISPEDEVIIPGLTCVVVPNAILYCKAKPVYADVRPDTLTLDVDSVANLINKKTKAIIIQNTFGLSADVDTLVHMARERNILALEDCTHGFGGFFKGHVNGTLADASFFSTQWNKPYSTGLGGILLVNRREFFPEFDTVNCNLISPEKKELACLWLSIQARRFLLTDSYYWDLLRLYRWLSKKGLITGSSSTEEIESTSIPEDFFKGFSKLQATVGVQELSNLDNVINTRRKAAFAYRQVLASHNKWHVSAQHDANNSHLKFPVLVRNRRAFFNAAEKEKIRLSDWFISPIHPVEKNFSDWRLDSNAIPRSCSISQKLVTVNTEVENTKHVCKFLTDNLDLIE